MLSRALLKSPNLSIYTYKSLTKLIPSQDKSSREIIVNDDYHYKCIKLNIFTLESLFATDISQMYRKYQYAWEFSDDSILIYLLGTYSCDTFLDKSK